MNLDFQDSFAGSEKKLLNSKELAQDLIYNPEYVALNKAKDFNEQLDAIRIGINLDRGTFALSLDREKSYYGDNQHYTYSYPSFCETY